MEGAPQRGAEVQGARGADDSGSGHGGRAPSAPSRGGARRAGRHRGPCETEAGVRGRAGPGGVGGRGSREPAHASLCLGRRLAAAPRAAAAMGVSGRGRPGAARALLLLLLLLLPPPLLVAAVRGRADRPLEGE